MRSRLERNRYRILVADDDPATALVTQFALRHAGFQAEVASDGSEAWQLLQNPVFDLLITDEQMPRLSGRELCKRLQDDPRLAFLPVIMITCKAIELANEKKLSGIRKLLHKPFSPSELIACVEELLVISHVFTLKSAGTLGHSLD